MEQHVSEVAEEEAGAILAPRKEQSEKAKEQEEDEEATIPMVYEAAGAVVTSVQETEEKESSRKTAERTKKRGKKGAAGSKKRKKPQSKVCEASVDQEQDPSSSIEQPATKQPRVERDPYEWTESQSNKAPTPMKIRRDPDADEEMILARRRLNDPEKEQEHMEAVSAAGEGSLTGARESAGGGDRGEGARKDSTPSKEQGGGDEPEQDTQVSPSKQQTPPVRREGDNDPSGNEVSMIIYSVKSNPICNKSCFELSIACFVLFVCLFVF